MSTTDAAKLRTVDIAYIAVAAVLIAVCSWISISVIVPVPFTLQTFGVFFVVGFLGGKRGTLAVLVYLILGVVGVPVFAGFSGGIGTLLGSTGGYIVGFVFTALIMWAFECRLGKKTWVLLLSMVVGLIVCLAFGTAWFMVVYANTTGEIGLLTALMWCVIPFIIPDILKLVLAVVLCNRLSKAIKLR